MLLLYSVLLLVGFLVLFKSADQFVIGSVATAKNLKISPMVVGLTVVALGTSAPEIFVAVASSLRGEPELAVGNAIGSNIANMGYHGFCYTLCWICLNGQRDHRVGRLIACGCSVSVFVTHCF